MVAKSAIEISRDAPQAGKACAAMSSNDDCAARTGYGGPRGVDCISSASSRFQNFACADVP
jgi:hypothetical protein